MNRTSRRRISAVATTTALAATTLLASAVTAQAKGVDLSNPAAVAAAPDHSCGGVTDSDRAVADRLNYQLTGTLRGYLTAYRVSCARAITEAVRARGLSERAGVIAVTTAIVETTLRNNPNEEDHDSVGLFQQRAFWGSFEQRMDPTWSTNAFLAEMLKISNWQTRPIGEVCQAVQRSAYPSKYQPQSPDAQRIVDALWNGSTTGGDLPVSGNWDGGAASNVGVWRNGMFHLRNDDGSTTFVDWGGGTDLPVSANWDGTGPDNVGIFRPSTGQFHLRMDDGSLALIDWGGGTDQPVAGNWDGGAAANVGIWRDGKFHLRNDDGTPTYIDWGQAGDRAVSGNWDGTGPDNVGIFRPSTGQFHLRMDDGSLVVLDWGGGNDIPVAGNWDGGNGGPAANIGIWRPSQARFHLRNDDGTPTYIDWGQPR
ncbi:hypothetical protein DEJ50_04650 [Streptomyces venezuelae]|uniref:Uncharacterized protein n=1 Tax=Streptomyces venezuelae TaxID=54571 RepID=A0A5P2CZ31_STRVZ|nr:hypothetical protein [Streptomyces venezuelae]QES47227.1 hypothetical protein DEJ50_04650 [Streptomyces venezuelae]